MDRLTKAKICGIARKHMLAKPINSVKDWNIRRNELSAAFAKNEEARLLALSYIDTAPGFKGMHGDTKSLISTVLPKKQCP